MVACDNDKKKELQKRLKKIVTIVFIVLFVSLAGIFVSIFFILNNQFKQEYTANDFNHISSTLKNIIKEISTVKSDIIYLKNICTYKKVNPNKPEGLDPKLEQQFYYFSLHRKIYDQIRVLNLSGQEVLRINFNNNSPVIVPKDQLQNKQGRYYFEDTISLEGGEIFISPLDLNVEYGKIEVPYKPVVRVGTPIIDEFGKTQGIVLLNVYGNEILGDFSSLETMSDSEMMLVNSDGYWLWHKNDEYRWTFMFEDKKHISFKEKYPQEWTRILTSSKGVFETSNGLFSFLTIRPLSDGDFSSTGSPLPNGRSAFFVTPPQYFWKIISLYPYSDINKQTQNTIMNLSIVFIIIFVASGIAVFLLLRFRVVNKQMDAERKENQQIQNYFELGLVGMALISPNKILIKDNQALLQMLEYTCCDIDFINFDRLVYEKDRFLDDHLFKEVYKNQRVGYTIEKRFVTKYGKIINSIMSLRGVYLENGELEYCIILIQDISELKKAHYAVAKSQSRLRKYANHIENVREEERRSIAHNLHDDLGQILSALKLDMFRLQRKTPFYLTQVTDGMKEVVEGIDEAVKTVQRMSSELRPVLLDRLGLVPAIEHYLKEFTKRTEIYSNLYVSDKKARVEKSIETIIFRIFQEAMTNVSRHSMAKEVVVSLYKNDVSIQLSISDNGKGVSEEVINNHTSFGILGMKERCSSLGGDLAVAGIEGDGTTVILKIPLKTGEKGGVPDFISRRSHDVSQRAETFN